MLDSRPTVARSNRLLLLYPLTHPPTYLNVIKLVIVRDADLVPHSHAREGTQRSLQHRTRVGNVQEVH